MPLEIDWITRMPSSAAQAVPRPPNRLVPPMTAAAIALSRTSPPPGRLVHRAAAGTRRACRPSAANVDASTKTATRTRWTWMPARRAASALPPTA